MRIDNIYEKSSVLIGTAKPGTKDEIDPWGSGFLVDVGGQNGVYLITAEHLFSQLSDAPFSIRFNKKGGGAENHHIDPPNWISHPTDYTVDVGVHHIQIPEWADCSVIPRDPIILGEDRFKSKNFGLGNRTYTIGLWKFFSGDKQNQPFAYSGYISLIPKGQKIPVKL